MMKYIVTLNGKKYEVEVEKTKAVLLGVADENSNAQVSLPVGAETPCAPSEGPSKSDDVEEVKGIKTKSPMTGTVLEVNFSEGKQVKKGDVLFVLEAMKMENEIFASTEGTVLAINAPAGSSVENGEVVITLS